MRIAVVDLVGKKFLIIKLKTTKLETIQLMDSIVD
jgi:hypothetical protein